MPRHRRAQTNLVGQSFGRLLVVDQLESIPTRGYKWDCLCSCGKKTEVFTGSLKSGHTQSCGCLQREISTAYGKTKFKDLSGQRFGRLVAVGVVSKYRSSYEWLCACDCGGDTVVLNSRLISGVTSSCGCLRELSGISARFAEKKDSGLFYVISKYTASAKSRSLEWALTEGTCRELFNSNCYYCTSTPSNKRKTSGNLFLYTGIDRVDNTKGYLPDNVVPCCKVCNRAKDTMSQEEFIHWSTRVAEQFLRREVNTNG